MVQKLLAFIALALLLAGCEAGLFFGSLPSNEACRASESLPPSRSAATASIRLRADEPRASRQPRGRPAHFRKAETPAAGIGSQQRHGSRRG
jgi:hypothetical protein